MNGRARLPPPEGGARREEAGSMDSTIRRAPGVSTDGSPVRRRARGCRPAAWAALAAGLALAQPAAAWWGDTHALMTRAAVLVLPPEVPAFFRAGAEMAAHVSFDPDIAKNRGAPHVRHAEHPEHFADIELLQGEELPDQRYEFVALCHTLGVAPEEVGFAPYAVAEYAERLAVAFAEHRKWPENEAVRVKCLVYAGFLAHYAGDIVQPLHATIHYNGRVGEDGSRAGAGIHEKVDSLIERIGLTAEDLAEGVRARPVEGELFAAVREQVLESNRQVDRVYELAGGLDPPGKAARAFAAERGRRAAAFTASLYLTAWRMSEGIRLPSWLERSPGPVR